MSADKIKEAAFLKVWSKLQGAVKVANNPDTYWKMDADKRVEMREKDIFDRDIWSYILELIEKDNVL